MTIHQDDLVLRQNQHVCNMYMWEVYCICNKIFLNAYLYLLALSSYWNARVRGVSHCSGNPKSWYV